MFKGPRYSNDELITRLKVFVGVTLSLTLTGIVFVVLYSLIFAVQPMTQSPNDAKFFELITPIATFLTGILSGIMLGKTEEKKEEKAPETSPAETPLDNVVDTVEDEIA
jgi:hypothetical protein